MNKHLFKSELQLKDFEYDLPAELIAQEPLLTRHASRLLAVNRSRQTIEHYQFSQLAELLQPLDLLVLNDTKVIPARLWAKRESGALIEILLLQAQPSSPGIWLALASPLRKLKVGEYLKLEGPAGQLVRVDAFIADQDGHKRVLLNFGSGENVYKILAESGRAPLPPYVKRCGLNDSRQSSDLERYQTIFAQAPGAV